MTDTTVLSFRQPGEIADPLTEVLRQGARELLAQAIEAEVCAHLEAHTHLKTDQGLQRIVPMVMAPSGRSSPASTDGQNGDTIP